MLNVVPVFQNSLVNTASKVCQRGWLKEQFVDSFKSLWLTSSCAQHEQSLNDQIDKFNYDLHVDLSSIASMLQIEAGLLGGYFFSRVQFTRKLKDSLYKSWTLICQSAGNEGHSVVAFRLYECPYNPEKLAVVFETTVGLVGFAEWNYDLLEVWSEEQQSEDVFTGDKYDEAVAELLAQNCKF